LTQGFHRKHFAIDIANKLDTPIYAAAGGKIVESADGWNYGFGKYIIIDHGNEIQTVYAHLNKRKVEVGAEIQAGQLIGLMGNTGNVFGPTGIHLHFELRIRGRKVDPRNYFN
jgi:Membrane proteins related to metalloendopeptidases